MATQSTPSHLPSTQPPSRSSLNTGNDSDWEYEYDDNETEDIYFTLDLTTHVPNAIQEKTYAKNGKLIRPDKNTTNTTAGETPLTAPVEANGQDVTEIEGDNVANQSGKLQILDLHTEKPYVKFNNGFYSCHWFTDLGTQFWITNPGVVSDPKLSGHVLDVVSSSQTRLVAKPANLKRKRGSQDHAIAGSENATQPLEAEDNAASDVSDTEDRNAPFDIPQDPNKPLVIPRRKINDPHLAAQADFMERLSAVKLRKGEPDAHRIPLRVPVYYRGAHNADELRALHASVADDAEPRRTSLPPAENLDSPMGAGATPSETPTQPPTTQPTPATATEEPSPLPLTLPTYTRRPRGGHRGGGVPSNASRRSNLGLELMSEAPRRKRGRVSNAEKARRAAEAEAQTFALALDPQLGGGEEQQAGHEAAEGGPAEEQEEEEGAGEGTPAFKPRKRRRTKAQMEEARRLDAERRALETAEMGRSTRRTSGRRNAVREAEEANEARARERVVIPGQVGREIAFRFDGAQDGEGDGEGGGSDGEEGRDERGDGDEEGT